MQSHPLLIPRPSHLRVSWVCQPPSTGRRFCRSPGILSNSSDPGTVNAVRDPSLLFLCLHKPHSSHLKNGSKDTTRLPWAQSKSVLGEHVETWALTWTAHVKAKVQLEESVVSNLDCVLRSHQGNLLKIKSGFLGLTASLG